MRLDFNTTLNGGTRKKLRNWNYIAGKATTNILNTFGMTRQNIRLTTLTLTCNMKEKRPHNTGFASGGLTCKLGASCFYSSSVLVDSFVLRNPPERKALYVSGNITNTDKIKIG
jgi:hypothetical protein